MVSAALGEREDVVGLSAIPVAAVDAGIEADHVAVRVAQLAFFLGELTGDGAAAGRLCLLRLRVLPIPLVLAAATA